MSKVLLCGELFCAVDCSVKKNQAILIEDGVIADIRPIENIPVQNKEIIDLQDCFVMPGLIDAHVHTVMDAVPMASQNLARKTYGELAFLSMKNAQDDLMAGFTSLRDECSYGWVDVALRDAINNGITWGPRMMVAGPSISCTGGHGDSHYNPEVSGYCSLSIVCDGADECRKAARKIFKYGADHLKLCGTGGVGSIGDEPGASELTYDEMKAAIDVAKSKGRTSSVHAHGAGGIKTAVLAGITSVEHGMLIDEETMDLLVEKGVYLVPTIIASHNIIRGGEKGGMPAHNVQKAKSASATHREHLMEMRRKGVKIAFGSDAGTAFNRHGKQGEEFALMVETGFTPEEALLSGTRCAAELMRWDKKVGTIEAGKYADIVAFPRSPLEDIAVMQECGFVMKQGVVYRNDYVDACCIE